MDGFAIPFPDGDRVFPWVQSYGRSRWGFRSYAVGVGLMALEAWAHDIGSKPASRSVTGAADVLGEPGSPGHLSRLFASICCSPIGRITPGRGAVPRLPGAALLDRERLSNDISFIPISSGSAAGGEARGSV